MEHSCPTVVAACLVDDATVCVNNSIWVPSLGDLLEGDLLRVVGWGPTLDMMWDIAVLPLVEFTGDEGMKPVRVRLCECGDIFMLPLWPVLQDGEHAVLQCVPLML